MRQGKTSVVPQTDYPESGFSAAELQTTEKIVAGG
jgi:hypothetical protein